MAFDFENFDRMLASTQDDKSHTILKPPFGWPGGKQRLCKRILPHLPYRNAYIEPFGGCGVILLNRGKSELEVFNDRFSGITDFYRVLRDPALFEHLLDRLEFTPYSREEFEDAVSTWENTQDPVERAAKWYVMIEQSFCKIGRNWGRVLKGDGQISGRWWNTFPGLRPVHERLKNVYVENRSWEGLLLDYDAPDAVFYLDPPYIDVYSGTYKHEMSSDDHIRMLHKIHDMKAFVAVSGYDNPTYRAFPWDQVVEFDTSTGIQRTDLGGSVKDQGKCSNVDCLWIKE